MRVAIDQSFTWFSVAKALKEDIPSLIDVHRAAWAPDNAGRLMHSDEAEYREKLRKVLDSEMPKAKNTVLKAVCRETGGIVGWIGFARVGYPGLESKEEIEEKMKQEEPGTRLGRLIQEDTSRVKAKWMSNKKYVHVGTLVTHPDYERRGVGTALIQQAIAKADADSVPCWLESTSIGHGLYNREGFGDVGNLEIDLSEFAPGGKSVKRGWGIWEAIYMVRLPENINTV